MKNTSVLFFIAASLLTFNTSARAEDGTAAPATITVPAWVNTVTVGGDLRYRLEEITQKDEAVESFKQDRIRARLSVKADPAPGRQIEFRLATGGGRVSTNQTLGNNASGSSSYTFQLDRAVFKQTLIDGVSVSGGRMGNPWTMALESDLIWDADINFDGLALKAEHKMDPVTLWAVLSSHWLDKASSTAGKVDVQLQSAQLGVKSSIGESSSVLLALSSFSFEHIQNHGLFAGTTTLQGNTAGAAANTYAHDYRVNSVGLEFTTTVADIPVSVGGEVIQNTGATADRNGSLIGFKVGGKPKKAGEIGFGYDYRTLDKDATVGAFIDGDTMYSASATNGASTNGGAHRVGLTYIFSPGFGSTLTLIDGFVKNTADEKIARKRAMFDFNLSF